MRPAIKEEPPPKKKCCLCKEEIPRGAMRCNKCTAYQRGWRKGWPLPSTVTMIASFAGLLGVIATFTPFAITQWTNYRHRHSDTRVEYAGLKANPKADPNADPSSDLVVIYAHLWNTGRRESSVDSYFLDLKAIHAENVPLLAISDEKHEVRSVIPPGGDVTNALLIRGLIGRVKNPQTNERYSRQEVLDAASREKVQIVAKIKESKFNKPICRCGSIDAGLLGDVVWRRFPNPSGGNPWQSYESVDCRDGCVVQEH